MKKIILLVIIIIIGFISMFPVVNNDDKPSKGELYLKLEKVWQIEDAGETPFARIRDLMVHDDGRVYIYDSKNLRIYIVSKEGKPVRAFGKRGEGPGEIRQLNQAYLRTAGNKLLIMEDRLIHYFQFNGDYIRSRKIPEANNPLFFLNEDEYITAPLHLRQIRNKNGIGKICRVNLKTDKKNVIKEFSMFKGGMLVSKAGGRATVTDTSLTPMMIINHHNNRLYFGMNDDYKITVSDMKGNTQTTFGLIRKKRWISDKVKEDELVKSAKDRAPVELLKRLAKTMSNEMNYFGNIEVHNGLIYVFTPYYVRNNTQQIDVFSSKGLYLYRAFIKVNEEYEMVNEPVIKKGYVYICLENQDGDITVNKYKIDLPNK